MFLILIFTLETTAHRQIIEQFTRKLGVLSFLEILVNAFTKQVFNIRGATRVLRHVFFDVVDDTLEYHYLVIVFVSNVIL